MCTLADVSHPSVVTSHYNILRYKLASRYK